MSAQNLNQNIIIQPIDTFQTQPEGYTISWYGCAEALFKQAGLLSDMSEVHPCLHEAGAPQPCWVSGVMGREHDHFLRV